MTVNQRQKGARGEREWAKVLRDMLGCAGARRAAQNGVKTGRDVEHGIPNTNAEVKRHESFTASDMRKAMAQSVRDAEPGEVPYVAHKRNHRPWTVTVRASDLRAMTLRVLSCPAARDDTIDREQSPEDLLLTIPADDLMPLARLLSVIIDEGSDGWPEWWEVAEADQ